MNITIENDTAKSENATELKTYIAFEVVIAVVALAGNSLVLAAIWKFRSLRSPTNCFVASLAVADIAVAVFAIPSAILLRFGLSVKHDSCPYVPEGPSVGEMACLLMITSVIFLTQVSIFSLTVIAIDRFIAITHPFKYQSLMRSRRVTKISIALVWVLGVLIGLIPQLGWNQWVYGDSVACDRKKCDFEDVIKMEYMVYFNFLGCVLLPLVIMGVVYVFIFRSAKMQLRKIYFDVRNLKSRSRSAEIFHNFRVNANGKLGIKSRDRHEKQKSGVGETSGHWNPVWKLRRCISEGDKKATRLSSNHRKKSSEPRPKSQSTKTSPRRKASMNGNDSNSSRSVVSNDYVTIDRDDNADLRRKMKRKKQLLQKEFRAARSLATVVFVFAVCWLPLHIMNVCTLICPTCYQPNWLKDLAILLSHANSMVNPFIYAYSMRDFRTAFRRLLSCVSWSHTDARCVCGVNSMSDSVITPEFSSDDLSRDHQLNDNRNIINSSGPLQNDQGKTEMAVLRNYRDTPSYVKPCPHIMNNSHDDSSVHVNKCYGLSRETIL